MDERKPKTKRVFTKISKEEQLKRKEEAKKYKQMQTKAQEPVVDPPIDYEKMFDEAMDILDKNLLNASTETKMIISLMDMYSPDYRIYWPVLISCQNDLFEATEILETLDDFSSPSKYETYFIQLKIVTTLLKRAVFDYAKSTDVHPELIMKYIEEKRKNKTTSKQEVALPKKKESDSLS